MWFHSSIWNNTNNVEEIVSFIGIVNYPHLGKYDNYQSVVYAQATNLKTQTMMTNLHLTLFKS